MKKLKDILNEALKKPINEDDWSDMRLHSNIDEKWGSTQDMIDDLTQWIKASTMAGGRETLEDFENAIREVSDFIIDLDRERDRDTTSPFR